jgi:indole-3-glycerol phosphate synthase
MSRFANSEFNLKSLADNSYKAIEEGAYDAESYDFTRHDSISMKSAILSCSHAPIITEIKFASPSKGQIVVPTEMDFIQLAINMISSGSIGLSVLTQPYLFNGSIDYLARIRKKMIVPILMKDIIVSETQIDAAKRIGADCVLFIKAIFDQNLAESGLEKLAEYAFKKGLQILVEVHSENEFADSLKLKEEYRDLIGINNRDLNNLEIDILTTYRLLKKYDKGKNIIISESGITNSNEIRYLKKAGANAFLIGTSIMESNDIVSKVRQLYLSI